MNPCEICGCQTFERYTLESGEKVCEYCEMQYRQAKNILAQACAPVQRDYNNLTWLIKQDNKTVRNWAKKHGFSYAVVEQVLHKKGHYAQTDIHRMSPQHFDIIMALCDDGYTDTLVNEEYVTRV